jgi:dTDP-4-amino-4,6-dideoxygalactose transaminase
VLLHRHPFFGRHADVSPAELPCTERLAAETLVLPTNSALDDGDVTRLADLLASLETPEPRGVALAG